MKINSFLLVVFMVGILHANIYSAISSRVEGQILDKDSGEPIPGAAVNLFLASENGLSRLFEWNETSDENGHFRFELDGFYVKQNGKFLLQCNKEGYIPFLPKYYEYLLKQEFTEKAYQIFRVVEGKVKHVKIELKKGGTLNGTIRITGLSGKSPESIRCELRLDTSKHSFLLNNSYIDLSERKYVSIHTFKFDENGNFKITGLEPSKYYYIRFFNNGHRITQSDFISISAGEELHFSQTLDYSDKSGIEGVISITDYELSGGEVVVTNRDDMGQVKNMCIYFITNDGKYFCYGLPSGIYEVNISVRSKDLKVFTKTVSTQIQESKTKILNFKLTNEGGG